MNQLLEVMKIDEEKLRLTKESINITKIIENCIDELSYLIKEKNHALIREYPQNIILMGDKERLFQVFSNLLSNAIKFTPKNGEIQISAEKEEDLYKFSITDNGIGLIDSELARVFNKFERFKQTVEEGYEKETGTGLGLYISKGIVEAHGGEIKAFSEGRNKGTTFTFTLPIN
ncbi:MAG: HAMP domain-containing histidine kinase [Promethearchaeota archaeon]|nr:MAG: HAMP domain-containing histidine kinase [Candidatus Lokiarchaeota archaeon]